MWGFLTCLNDILVPHLKLIFDLSYARAMLIQFAFFSAYFLFSVPWSKIMNTIPYKTTMVVGLLTMAVGAFLFIPAASIVSYPLFLRALLVLAAGITGLQVSANPYVVMLGKPEAASSRLDLTQDFGLAEIAGLSAKAKPLNDRPPLQFSPHWFLGELQAL
jgi:FHS family L-fucose permease-like MFS transporter